jgi:hypothetical protein
MDRAAFSTSRVQLGDGDQMPPLFVDLDALVATDTLHILGLFFGY